MFYSEHIYNTVLWSIFPSFQVHLVSVPLPVRCVFECISLYSFWHTRHINQTSLSQATIMSWYLFLSNHVHSTARGDPSSTVNFGWFVAFGEHQNFPRLKLIEIVILWVYYTIPFGFSLFWHFLVITFQYYYLPLRLRITDEGSVPEMRIWSMS